MRTGTSLVLFVAVVPGPRTVFGTQLSNEHTNKGEAVEKKNSKQVYEENLKTYFVYK